MLAGRMCGNSRRAAGWRSASAQTPALSHCSALQAYDCDKRRGQLAQITPRLWQTPSWAIVCLGARLLARIRKASIWHVRSLDALSLLRLPGALSVDRTSGLRHLDRFMQRCCIAGTHIRER